jgi:hypothetical protein
MVRSSAAAAPFSQAAHFHVSGAASWSSTSPIISARCSRIVSRSPCGAAAAVRATISAPSNSSSTTSCPASYFLRRSLCQVPKKSVQATTV